MRTLILIPCTDRKRQKPRDELCARSLESASVHDLATEWFNRVASAKQTQLHGQLYCGRAYREAANAAKELSAELTVISAGLGVVRADRCIPAYSLTVASGKDDTILDKITCGGAYPEAWWSALKRAQGEGTGIHQLVRIESPDLILIALSANYARLIHEDLMALSAAEAKRIRIFGAGIAERLPAPLRNSVMPYDVRLNGPDSPIPGAMSDFSSRALHHFAMCLKDGLLAAKCVEGDRWNLECLMSTWKSPAVPVRQRMTDDEVVGFIAENWEKSGGRSGVSLRLLRDNGNACEQSRFKDLFRIVRDRREEDKGSAA